MPIFEYECLGCKSQFQSLVITREDKEKLFCPRCGGRALKKLISRVAYHMSESDRLASYNPKAAQGESYYRDSRNIGLNAMKRAENMGVDLGSAFNEKLEKLRTDPGSVLKDSE